MKTLIQFAHVASPRFKGACSQKYGRSPEGWRMKFGETLPEKGNL
jgi:hypothetical protein